MDNPTTPDAARNALDAACATYADAGRALDEARVAIDASRAAAAARRAVTPTIQYNRDNGLDLMATQILDAIDAGLSGYGAIASRVGCSRRTVIRRVQSLVRDGEIGVVTVLMGLPGRASNAYITRRSLVLARATEAHNELSMTEGGGRAYLEKPDGEGGGRVVFSISDLPDWAQDGRNTRAALRQWDTDRANSGKRFFLRQGEVPATADMDAWKFTTEARLGDSVAPYVVE